MNERNHQLLFSAIAISIGLIAMGFTIAAGLYHLRTQTRTVTIKGIAERSVRSDLGIWEINYREIGNDLTKLAAQIGRDHEVVSQFLKRQGFRTEELERTPIRIEDRLANVYNQQQDTTPNTVRYVVSAGTRVRSAQVDRIHNTTQIVDQLLQQGVTVAFDLTSISPNPSYYYMNLDKIRPAMLSEATHSAYLVATQFAKDAKSHLAGIEHANQGQFQIMSKDTSTLSADWNTNQSALGSIDKKVRLVSTIEYRLVSDKE